MNEPEVLLRTHHYLKTQQLWQQPIVRLYTDAHSSLLPFKALRPFQRFSLDMGDFTLHPDLVGQLGDGETVFAVEAKGDKDLLRGLAQAEMYQVGFHYTFLAADAAALGESYVDFARRKNIGVFAVGESKVEIISLPQALMPLRRVHEYIARQMESVVQVSGQRTYQYNIPTHYLAWVIALEPRVQHHLGSVSERVKGYPMPKGWRSTLGGAQKLGLVLIQGDLVQLSPVGEAVKDILPATLDVWAEVHQIVAARGNTPTLAQYAPQAAAVLRLLLLNDPMVRLVIEGLQQFPDRSANFAELAKACDQIDHARAPIFFLKPESAAALTDDRGKISWNQAVGEDYRSSTFYQYKSILKHAGILADTTLGAASAIDYDPTQDVWTLR